MSIEFTLSPLYNPVGFLDEWKYFTCMEKSFSAKSSVTVRFYEELNYFLPKKKRKTAFKASLNPGQSVKDLVESLGVPHTEVDLILVNGESVDFSFQPGDGASVSVYPVFESFDITGVTRLRPVPLRDPSFVLDVHLGTLARYLRLLGFRADYRILWDDAELVSYAENNRRIILTRDRGILKRKTVSRGMFIYSTDPNEQLTELCRRLDLSFLMRPFTRCLTCGGMLHPLALNSDEFEKVRGRIPPGVLSWCREYERCSSCGKIYWKGSHMDHLKKIVSGVLGK